MCTYFNEHMQAKFTPSTIVCLDESMVTFDNPDAPVFVHVERKPHPNGAEYHTIACASTRIIFKMELVDSGLRDGKYEDPFGKMGGLILRMTEELRTSGRIVVMDSAFCLLRVLRELLVHGLFACTVAKKRQYWPRYFRGEDINPFMQGRRVGEIHGRMADLNGTPFRIFAVNHTTYTCILVSTYGTSEPVGPPRRVKTTAGVLTYTRSKVLSDYYDARHAVDDNNRLRQDTKTALDEAWPCKSWTKRQLLFLLSLTEVNSFHAWTHFVAKPAGLHRLTFVQFRDMVCRRLLDDYVYGGEDEPASKRRRMRNAAAEHELIAVPPYHGAFRDGAFVKVKHRNQQQVQRPRVSEAG